MSDDPLPAYLRVAIRQAGFDPDEVVDWEWTGKDKVTLWMRPVVERVNVEFVVGR